MTLDQQFPAGQWRTLRLAPFLVLSGISGRSRDFAAEEARAFERLLAVASHTSGVLAHDVLTSVLIDLSGVTADFETYAATPASGLIAVGRILADQPHDEAELFRDALVKVIGMGIASARGPYGRQPTTEAAQTLVLLDGFLRTEPAGSGISERAA